MNVVTIFAGAIAFLAVSWLADNFLFKKEFDPRSTIFNGVVVAVLLGISAVVTKKTAGGKGILEVSEAIAQK